MKILELKNSIKKMKNTLEGTGSTADCMEERISEPGDMKAETIQEEERETRSEKKKLERFPENCPTLLGRAMLW